jgi:hypothetical protein
MLLKVYAGILHLDVMNAVVSVIEI